MSNIPDSNPPTEPKTSRLCDSCAGIQPNGRRAPDHPGTHRTEAHKHGQVTITKYRCERCDTVWKHENNKVNRHAGWSVVGAREET